jgi:hypothetical protein
MDQLAWSPERIADRMEIQNVLHRYCRAVDRIQTDWLADVFHADALIDNGNYRGDVAGFVANVGQRHPGVPFASHMVMNALIDFVGPDRAYVESWCLALEQHPPAGDELRTIDRTFRVRYGDIFERRAGEWRIASRTFVIDHIMSAPVDPAVAPSMTGRILGRRDRDDPIVKARLDLGLAG